MKQKFQSAHKRIAVLDDVRGMAVVNMVIYHGLYDWAYVFGHTMPWFETRGAYWWQQAICWTFILVAGAVSSYGRHPYRRGAVVFGCGLLLTFVTALAMPSQLIVFGVLSLLGAGMLLTAALRPALHRVPAQAGAMLCFAVFLFTKGVPSGFCGIGDHMLWRLPKGLYSTQWAFAFGFPGPGFHSSDYFPLLPWLFLFWTGMYAWRLLEPKLPGALRQRSPLSIFSWPGRHSLFIYLLHQPVLMLLLTVANVLAQ